MKDALKRVPRAIKLYFRRRKTIKAALKQWADATIAQEEALKWQQMHAEPAVPMQPVFNQQVESAMRESVNELVQAVEQPVHAAMDDVNRLKMDIINRRVGA